jgi:hypothetical protein
MNRSSNVWLLLRKNLIFAGLLTLCLPLCARSKPTASHVADRDYLSALARANQFLHAWQIQDREAGLEMVSDDAKRAISENRLETFLSPGPEAAFEISRGKKLQSGRYAFPVALFGIREDGKTIHLRSYQLIVVKTGKDDWAIDRLP